MTINDKPPIIRIHALHLEEADAMELPRTRKKDRFDYQEMPHKLPKGRGCLICVVHREHAPSAF